MIARWSFRLRGWLNRDIDHANDALCVCCNRRLNLPKRKLRIRWYTIGSGMGICDRHPDNKLWPVKRWEHSGNIVLQSLPLTHWHPRERGSWIANHPKDAVILGMHE